MSFDFLKKTIAAAKSASGAGEAAPNPLANFKPDLKKAAVFFDRAKSVAESSNYEFAITLYTSGLKFDPANLAKHEATREVGMKYKATGGKPVGMLDAMKSGGKDPLEKLAHAELIWAKDPLSSSAAVGVMEKLVEAHRLLPDEVDLIPVIRWIGRIIIDSTPRDRKFRAVFSKTTDLFAAIEDYQNAVDACSIHHQVEPNDDKLNVKWRDLQTELTIHKGKFDSGDFKNSVKDMDKQKQLEQEEQTHRSESTQEEIIARRRAEAAANPTDPDLKHKLANELLSKENPKNEAEAIEILTALHAETGQYRFKMQVGDVKMRQIRRKLSDAKAAQAARPEDAALKQAFNDLRMERLVFETQEYQERVKNYPTDMKHRFELGMRLLEAKKFDDAIQYFQDAQTDPRNRARAMYYLSLCYEHKGWLAEAIDTLGKAITVHPTNEDALALDLRYLIMRCNFAVAVKERSIPAAREAQKWGSGILQVNINYKDIRAWSEKIRTLVEELSKAP